MLPGFDDGLVSVQDIAPQLAANFLDLQNGQHVLDACAAPGGKTAHIMEASNGKLTADSTGNRPTTAAAHNSEYATAGT